MQNQLKLGNSNVSTYGQMGPSDHQNVMWDTRTEFHLWIGQQSFRLQK